MTAASIDLGVGLPERWAAHPVVVTESAHNDWAVRQAWWSDDALLLRMRRRVGIYADPAGTPDGLYAVGTPEGVARLVLDAGPLDDLGRTTAPRGTRRELAALAAATGATIPAPYLREPTGLWDWFLIDRNPGPFIGEERVEELTGQDGLAEAAAALAVAHPGGELTVDDPRSRWWGWRGDDGRLHSIVGAARRLPGAPWVLGSIGTDPAYRGRGLGAATTAVAVRAGLREAPYVTLGMYAANAAARRTYERVGFRVLQEFESAH